MSNLKFISKVPIYKGLSNDKKYRVTTDQGEMYLLRFIPEEKYTNHIEVFHIQKQLASLGVPMSHPVAYGKCDEGFYALYSWIEGKDAREIIPHLSELEQYNYGFEAGKLLTVIHSIQNTKQHSDWESRFNDKIEHKIKMYHDCPYKFKGADNFITYLKNNRHLLANRPQCFQHGDYHIGNMMIEKDKIVIIDFDRYDFGDPWEEFNRIVWCAQVSPLFATGLINGYFENEVPMEFWDLLALYISNNMISSIPWAIQFGHEEVRNMIDLAKEVLGWYQNMQNTIPTWYIK